MPTIEGGSGSDTLDGTRKNDEIYGFGGNDDIGGAAGNDVIVGGTGDDELAGGKGADIFRYDARSFGDDVIEDFKAGDRIDLRGLNVADFATLEPYIEETLDGVSISLTYSSNSESIFLDGVTLDDLSSNSFVFNTSTKGLTVTGTNSFRDVLFGGGGDDRLNGLSGDDQLNGGAGDDLLIGGGGDDLLRGGAGADTFRYDARSFGDDAIADFGRGDRIDLRALNVADFATLAPYLEETADGVLITLGYFSNSESIFLDGVTLDQLSGKNFIFNASARDLTVTGTSSFRDVLFGGRGDDRLNGLSGDDKLNGGAGADVLIGGGGDDLLRGGVGADTFRYDARSFGDDAIADFGRGDRIDLRALNVSDFATLAPYIEETADGVLIELGYASNSESIFLDGVTLDQLSGKNFIFNASARDLTVTGTSSFRDVLFGGNGDDEINGLSGDDQLNGGSGADVLIGGGGDDILRGGAGADIFRYDARSFGDDVITDFATGDRIDFRALNIADFTTLAPYLEETADGVLIELGYFSNSESIFLDGATLDELSGKDFIFNNSTRDLTVTGTSSFRDVLFGGLGDDRLSGLSGDDQLNGGRGADTLIGGSGSDILRGGPGTDTFRFESLSGVDQLVDFQPGVDQIQLDNAVFDALANGALPGEAFNNGSAAEDASDRIIYNRSTGVLLYDADGLGGDRAIQIATLTSRPALTDADFTVV